MMFRKKQFDPARTDAGDTVVQHFTHKNFFFHPDGHCGHKTFQSPGGKCMIGFQKPFQFQIGFFVKGHTVKIRQVTSALPKAVCCRMDGKDAGMFFTGKAFLVSGGHDPAVNQKRSGAVMIIRRYP
jgi:hypothetical protein